MKRLLLLSLAVAACSGSPPSDILAQGAAPPPSSARVTPDAPGPNGSADGSIPPSVADSGPDATRDASIDGGEDAPSDAATPDAADASEDAPGDAAEPKRYGVTFDGSQGARVGANLPADMRGQPVVTVEAWVRYDASSATGGIMHTGEGPYLAVATTGAHAGELATCLVDGSVCVYSGNALAVGAWHHAAIVLDNGSLCLYLDGGDKGCAASGLTTFPPTFVPPGADPTRWLSLGTYSSVAPSSKSTVDEVRISYTRRYAGAYTVPKHLASDAEAKLTLALDEGAGPTSGPATLYGGASWVEVTR